MLPTAALTAVIVTNRTVSHAPRDYQTFSTSTERGRSPARTVNDALVYQTSVARSETGSLGSDEVEAVSAGCWGGLWARLAKWRPGG